VTLPLLAWFWAPPMEWNDGVWGILVPQFEDRKIDRWETTKCDDVVFHFWSHIWKTFWSHILSTFGSQHLEHILVPHFEYISVQHFEHILVPHFTRCCWTTSIVVFSFGPVLLFNNILYFFHFGPTFWRMFIRCSTHPPTQRPLFYVSAFKYLVGRIISCLPYYGLGPKRLWLQGFFFNFVS
jgi:hypothetical protein